MVLNQRFHKGQTLSSRWFLAILLCPLLLAAFARETSAQVPIVTVKAEACLINEGETARFTIAASPAPSADLQVDFNVFISGTNSVIAVPGDLGRKSVTIFANQTTATYVVRTRDFRRFEDPETLRFYLLDRSDRESNPYETIFGRRGRWSAIVKILDKAAAASASFECSWSHAAEDAGTQNMTVHLTSPAPSAGVTVNYSVGGTATSGDDFTALPGSVQASAGETSVDIPLTIIDDNIVDPDETVILTLTGGSGYALRPDEEYTFFIDDNDATPEVSIAGGSAITEGADASFTLTASPAPVADLAVKVTVGQTGDFAASGETGSRTVTVGATGKATFMVSTTDDAADEANGFVRATVGVGSGYAVASAPANRAAVAVKDNDATPEVSIAGGSAITEGADASFTLTASPAPVADLAVKITVGQTGDFAASGETGSRTVTVGATGKATFTVSTTDDAADEADGFVSAVVGVGSGYAVASAPADRAAVAVKDNDATPEVSIAGGSAITEGADASFTLTASPAPAANLSVKVTVGQTGDFAASGETGSRTVTVGAPGKATFTVSTTDDAADEADGFVSAMVGVGSGYAVASAPADSAAVAVSDNDATPEVSIAGGSAITEGADASFTLTASPAPAANLSVKVTVGQTGDFAASGQTGSRTVTVGAPGKATFTVSTTDDAADEADGFVSAMVGVGSGYAVASAPADSAAVAVKDNDTPEAIFAPASATAPENAGVQYATVNLSPAPHASFALAYEVAGTADPGDDYAPLPGSVQVLANASSVNIPVSIIDDGEDERGETVILTLKTAAGYTLGSPDRYTLTIDDNDTPEVSIAGGGVVEEGHPASFTLTASPVPVAELSVKITVGQTGDFAEAGQTGVRMVAVDSTGKATFEVTTTDDNTDEENGSVSATVGGGAGYAAASAPANSATVAVNDNDGAPPVDPVVSMAGGSAIVEGGNASFTLTASPAPAANLTVNVTVTQSGDFAAQGELGARQVTIGASGSTSFAVSTTEDNVDEENGSVSATVGGGAGYAAASAPANSAAVAVNDNDSSPVISPPPPPPGPLVSVRLSASPNPVNEGGSAIIMATLSQPLGSAVTIPLAFTPGTAEEGDYGALASIAIAANEASGSGAIAMTRDPDTDNETFTVALGELPSDLSAGSPSSVEVTIMDHDNVFIVAPTSAESGAREIPTAFGLEQNYPNPFNPSTTIGFSLDKAHRVRLAVYDLLGHEVRVLMDGAQPAGRYSVSFDASDLASGTYLYILQTGEQAAARTMALLK